MTTLWLRRLACDHERIRAFAEDRFRWISIHSKSAPDPRDLRSNPPKSQNA